MLRRHGGEHVQAGFYLDRDSWQVTTISGSGGGTLDGTAAVRYLRVPTLAMLVFAPLMGALFAIFLPFIGIYLVLQFLAGKGWTALRHVVHTPVPRWHRRGHRPRPI